MINQRFREYFREKFFQENEKEFEDFLTSLEQPLARTIRIKPGKENIVKTALENYGWILSPTEVPRVFRVERSEDFDPFERRLGMNIHHLIGDFYIQELAAAHPVDLLADSQISDKEFLILDMASSPGGKTTQLAEYFPKSFIIANEPSRERIPQLLQNLERMGTPNVGITLYPGQQWKHFEEIFDRILLDAPCSGEGTLYKGTDATKNWHIKSIKNIANLQKKLFTSAFMSLKVGGEMVYSTCALNDLENEGILEWAKKKYSNTLEITFEKKFWPHKDKTGGFFMAKILKKGSINDEKKQNIKNANDEIRLLHRNINNWKTVENISLFTHRDKVLAIKNIHLVEHLLDKMYFMRFGEHIGFLENSNFKPTARSFHYILPEKYEIFTFENEEILDFYLHGGLVSTHLNEGWALCQYQENTVALEYISNETLSNNFPKEWRRNK